METRYTTKPKEHRRRTRADIAPEAEASSASASTATAGLPLFLRNSTNTFKEPGRAPQAASNHPTVQAKLAIGDPQDAYEQEADQTAERVVQRATLGSPSGRANATTNWQAPSIQAKCSACEEEEETIQTKRSLPAIPEAKKEANDGKAKASAAGLEGQPVKASPSEKAQRNDAQAAVSLPDAHLYTPEEELPIQTKAGNGGPAAAQRQPPSSFQPLLRQSKGGGNQLAPAIRSEMEPAFGRDLSHVRIHTDGGAERMNRSLNARAFTNERDIYFNAGEYRPASAEGRRLLAHELTHTVQQGAVSDTLQCFSASPHDVVTEPKPPVPNDGAEVEGRMGEKIANHPNIEEQDDLDEDEREAAKHPNRSEVKQSSNEIAQSGEAKPSVDRGALAEEKTADQKAQIQQGLEDKPPNRMGRKTAKVRTAKEKARRH